MHQDCAVLQRDTPVDIRPHAWACVHAAGSNPHSQGMAVFAAPPRVTCPAEHRSNLAVCQRLRLFRFRHPLQFVHMNVVDAPKKYCLHDIFSLLPDAPW